MDIKKLAQEVFEIESKEVANLSKRLTDDFEKAINAILQSSGKLIVSGMGKSGIIGKKIAATLASTGTPSFFLHPGEAYHGDLGMIEENDIVLLISNSGETDEVLKLIPFLKHQKNCTISMSCSDDSTLAKNTNYHLNIAVDKEACPLFLAPTSSTTATLVMGDALAVTLMKLRDFKEENFAKFHPGGALGKKLFFKVDDLCSDNSMPSVLPNETIKNVIVEISNKRLGATAVIENNQLLGVITDGDISRMLENEGSDWSTLKAKDIMCDKPKTIEWNELATKALTIMEDNNISQLIVCKGDSYHGIVHIHDILKEGIL